jgi:hypothetical protein
MGMRLHKWMTAVLALVLLALPGLPLAQRADRFAAVAPRMQEFVDKGEAAGVVTLIATEDRIIHLAAVGKTDLTKDRKMRTDDIFWIAPAKESRWAHSYRWNAQASKLEETTI